MPIEEEIIIKGETKQAEGAFSKLAKTLEELKNLFNDVKKEQEEGNKQQKETTKTTEKTSQATEDLGKKAKNSSKGVGVLSGGFKALGGAIKSAGIGLVISILAGLGNALRKNQKVVDGFNVVIETLSNIFNQVVSTLVSVIEQTGKAKENFNGLQAVLMGLIKLGLAPLKLLFYGINLAIDSTQLAWEKSFFGGGDIDKIKELNKSIEETKNNISTTGKEAIQAGKDVVNNFSDAVGEVKSITKLASEELKKVDTKKAKADAENLVRLRNQAKIAIAEQSRLTEEYDRQAEQLRQQRDNTELGLNERFKKNAEIADVLTKQEDAMKKQADAQIALARAELANENTIDNQVALIDAITNKKGILAQIEGFRSEQLANENALLVEQKDIQNSITEGANERDLGAKEFEVEQEEDPLKKLELTQEFLDLEFELLTLNFERKKELYAEDTQARIDAENEFLKAKQDFENQSASNTKLIEKTKLKITNDSDKKDLKLKQAKYDTFMNLASVSASFISGLSEEGAEFAKGIAVSQALISTYSGINKAFAETTGDFTPTQSMRFANAAAVGIAGFANVSSILSTNSVSSGGGSGSQGSAPVSAPSFNIVEGTPQNELSENILNQQNKPVEAFVVSRNVTNSEELNRNIENRATIR